MKIEDRDVVWLPVHYMFDIMHELLPQPPPLIGSSGATSTHLRLYELYNLPILMAIAVIRAEGV